jgi:D-alanine-D-alanine ligase
MEIKEASMKRKFGRIGVLMGGTSSEREISLKSGKAVFQALTQLGLDVAPVDIMSTDREENTRLLHSRDIEVAFIALHGSYGEDGQVQQLLEELRIPYTGSSPFAHRSALDKTRARAIFSGAGLRVPEGIVIEKGAAVDSGAISALGMPLVIKPANQGSSIGLSIIEDAGALKDALALAFSYDRKVLVEKYIKGRELTVGVLGEEALPVIEIVPKRRFFDFEAKYASNGMTEYVVPAQIPVAAALQAQRQALAAHRSLGCAGCSRKDLILAEEGGDIFVLEVNTIPGLTSTSLLPKAARTNGIEFPALCLRLLESAYEKK